MTLRFGFEVSRACAEIVLVFICAKNIVLSVLRLLVIALRHF